MSKHSPGPWEAWNKHGGHVMKNWRVGSRGKTAGIVCPVAVIDNCGVTQSSEEEYANARLIAAAPDLLAALQEFVAWPHHATNATIAKGRAAIAKAEGNS